MRLYRMELYKICSKKLFIFSALASMTILLLYFWSYVNSTESTINGIKYTGYQAVKIDREIAEEYKGALTDQKVKQIIEQYGFPNGVKQYYYTFLDRNYLNDIVMHGFSDGYFNDFNDYHVGTCTYPVEQTVLGQASTATGKTLLLAYSRGWQVFTEVLQAGCVLGMTLIVLALSPVFSEEHSINTLQILFTTKEGRTKDVIAKIAAGMTVVVVVYAVVILLDLVLSWRVFGLDGLNCFYGQVMSDWKYISAWNDYHNASTDYMWEFLSYFVFSCFLGMVETGAVSLYFSACCKNSFQSVITTALSLLVPLLFFVMSQHRGAFFTICNMFILVLLGTALMSFVPDFSHKGCLFAIRTICCVLPATIGYGLKNRFLFFTALPVWLIIEDMYYDMSIWKTCYPWMQCAVFGFAATAAVIFIMCGGRKYKRS